MAYFEIVLYDSETLYSNLFYTKYGTCGPKSTFKPRTLTISAAHSPLYHLVTIKTFPSTPCSPLSLENRKLNRRLSSTLKTQPTTSLLKTTITETFHYPELDLL